MACRVESEDLAQGLCVGLGIRAEASLSYGFWVLGALLGSCRDFVVLV